MIIKISGVPRPYREELRQTLERAVRAEFKKAKVKGFVRIQYWPYPKTSFLPLAAKRKWVYVSVGALPEKLQEPVTLSVADICLRHSGEPKQGRGRWWYKGFDPTHLLLLTGE